MIGSLARSDIDNGIDINTNDRKSNKNCSGCSKPNLSNLLGGFIVVTMSVLCHLISAEVTDGEAQVDRSFL
jgi:hypothetical protein